MFHDPHSVPLRRPLDHIATPTTGSGHPPMERRFPSLVAWAQAHGSQAQTPHGAKRFLKGLLQALRSQPSLPQRGFRPPPASRRERRDAYQQDRRNDRLNHRWQQVVQQDSYQATVDAYRRLPAALQAVLAPRCGGDIDTWAEMRALKLKGRQVELRDLTVGQYARAGDWWVLCLESRTTSWTRYSKAWHRAHGPVEEVRNRRVVCRRLTHGRLEERVVRLEAWRGDFVARALMEAGLVQPHRGLRHVRLHPAYDVRELRQHRGYRVYQRTLCGEPVDLCVVSPLGLTYHARTLRQAFRGLKTKTTGIEAQAGPLIDRALVRRLGFCDPGIQAFADAFHLDLHGQYTPDEIYHVVQTDPDAARPFRRELRLLAAALNSPVPGLT